MHTITVRSPIAISRGRTLQRGTYLADDVNAGHWLAQWPGRVSVDAPGPLMPWSPEAKSVIIIRPGGLGDLIMLTPILRALAAIGQRVIVVTLPHNAVVLEGLPFLRNGQIGHYPMLTHERGMADAVVPLENVLEHAYTPARTPALDLFAAEFPGLTIENRRPEYVLREAEVIEAMKTWPRPVGRKLVGVQLAASSPIRNYPRVPELLHALLRRGYALRLFGEPGRHPVNLTPGLRQRVQVLPSMTPAPTFRQSVALAAQCDCLVTPDSSLVHVAGALGLSCVALYGSFPARVRVRDYPTVHAIEGRGRCAECCHHGRPRRWPEGGPCEASNLCEVLDGIDPEEIANRVARQMGE